MSENAKLYKHYVGSASVQATPCTLGEYNLERGWELPANEFGGTTGYHVLYMVNGTPVHTTWIPATLFEQIFTEASTDVGGGVVIDPFWPVEYLDGNDADMMARVNKGGYDLVFKDPVPTGQNGWMPKDMFESRFRRRLDAAVHLDTYVCHKRVQAGKILFMARDDANDRLMLHIGGMANILPVPLEYLDRHKPELGGYYVRYADGYASYSPAVPFEQGYTKVDERFGGKDVRVD